ncbi:MAG: hypothetical protein ACE5K4_10845 [Candidatus Hydrothermarchaeota archaeon]
MGVENMGYELNMEYRLKYIEVLGRLQELESNLMECHNFILNIIGSPKVKDRDHKDVQFILQRMEELRAYILRMLCCEDLDEPIDILT